jgi:hypothetical protein
METKEKADVAIKVLVKMIQEYGICLKSSIETIEGFAKNIKDPAWRYGLATDKENLAKYADSLTNIVEIFKKKSNELESMDIDWEFDKH